MEQQDQIKIMLGAAIEKMPSLPTTVTKVIELANDINSSAKDLMKVIQLDPVLTAKVLKLINSAFFGITNKVSLKQAVVLLGINTIKNLALSSAIIGAMGRSKMKVPNFDQGRFWEHCLGTGVAAKMICKRIDRNSILGEEFFVGGLVHDIGKIVMAVALPNLFSRTIENARRKSLPSIQSEIETMGIGHAEVGSMLAQKWSFNDSLILATRFHHNPENGQDRLHLVVHVANCFVKKMGFTNSDDFAEENVDPSAFEKIGLAEQEVAETLTGLPQEIEKATVFLKS